MLDQFSNIDSIFQKEKIKTCFVDTTVLFSATYPFDLFNEQSIDAFDQLAALKIPVLTNVNVRAEFLENHRRVLIAECLIDFLEEMEPHLDGPLVEKLKSHRTSYRRKVREEKSTKIEVNQIKVFRQLLSSYGAGGRDGWESFCRNYLRPKLLPIWDEAQKELNLNFISLRSTESPYLAEPPEWQQAVELMGSYGLASSDAMILNIFLCSKIPAIGWRSLPVVTAREQTGLRAAVDR